VAEDVVVDIAPPSPLQLYMATNLQREADQRSPMEGLVRHRLLRDTLATRDLEVALRELGDHGAGELPRERFISPLTRGW
jgi:hypothetical protein